MSMAISWRLSAGQRLRRRQWDGECVLYNDLSGDTHLLGADALELLLALHAGPADTDALERRLLAAGLAAADDAGVATLLEDLERLALIEAVC
jgi:PqqD family protein of HPr-rel-A system